MKNMLYKKYFFILAIAFLATTLWVNLAFAQTTITNQAQATYKDALGTSYGPVSSNLVSVSKIASTFTLTCVLEGRTNYTAVATLYIKTAGTATVIQTITVNLTSTGTASPSQPSGLTAGARYDLVLKAPYYLTRKVSNVLWPPTATLNFGTALAGNLNSSDDMINTLDWSVMNSKWRTSDAVADINQDGQVNTIDWGIMNRNWRAVGQE